MSRLPPHLQHLTDGLPADKRPDIEEAIATSPYLQQRMTQAIEAGQLEHIRLTAPGANEGGHYDSGEKAVYISADTFTRSDLEEPRRRIDVITSILGHETGHALNAAESRKTLYLVTFQVTEEMRAAGPDGSADVTPLFALHQRAARRNEAMAEIEGWNALASRIQHTNGGNISRKEMLDRASWTTSCVKHDEKNIPHLARGIVLDQDMQMADTRLPKAGAINVEPVAQCHFDQSARSLGAQGKADYRNYYGAYLIEQIGQETASRINPPTLKLDLARLGLDPAQLESTGLNLGGKNLSLIDTGDQHRFITLRHASQDLKHTPDDTARQSPEHGQEHGAAPPAAPSPANDFFPEAGTTPAADRVPAGFGPALALPADLRDPTHPGHREFKDTLGKVHRMEAAHGIPHGPHSENVAAALLVAAERGKQGITHVEMRADGQVHGLERRYAPASVKEVAIDPGQALGVGMEQYARQWAQLRSPHFTMDAPVAERTPEQALALGQLSPADQAMFVRIRADTPAPVSDDHVAHAMLLAKQDGITDAGRIKAVVMAGDTLWVAGDIPGFRASVNVSEPVPGARETVGQTLAFNQQQREQQLAMDAMQQSQGIHHGHGGLQR